MNRAPPFLDAAAGLAAVAALALLLVPSAAPFLPWIKALPALIWSVSFLAGRGPGRALPTTALGFAAMGDFLLAEAGQFVFGVAAFAVFQSLFAVRFWTEAKHRPTPRRGLLAAPLVYGAVTVAVLAACLPQVGDLAVPMVLYGGLLTAMASGYAASGRGRILAWGGALFYLSDALILWFRAWPAPFFTDWMILIPYYLGIFLIARGISGASPSRAYL